MGDPTEKSKPVTVTQEQMDKMAAEKAALEAKLAELQKPAEKPAEQPWAPSKSAEADAINANQSQKFLAAKKGKPTGIGIGGRRFDATPFINVQYRMNNQTKMLGAAEEIISDEFKSRHPGWHYGFPVRESPMTRSYLAQGRYKAVTIDDINRNHPLAFVGDITTPDGKQVIWKQHILVAISPICWNEEYVGAENYAISRTVQYEANMADEIASALGGGWQATVEPRKETTETI